MSPSTLRRTAAVLALTSALALAGCGNPDDGATT